MVPSLSAQAVKNMVPIFLEKGMELVDKMMEDAAEKDMVVGEIDGEKKATRLETEGIDVKDWVVSHCLFVCDIRSLTLSSG